MWILVCLMSQSFLKLFFLLFFAVLIGWLPLFCLPGCWFILLYYLICSWFLLVHFSLVIMFSNWLFFFSLLKFSLSSTILLSSLVRILMTIFLEFFTKQINYLRFISFPTTTLGLPPQLPAFFFLHLEFSFCLTFSVCSYELAKIAISPNLGKVILSRSNFSVELCAKWFWQADCNWSGHVWHLGFCFSGAKVDLGCGALVHVHVRAICGSGCLGLKWALGACMLQYPIDPVVHDWSSLQVGKPSACVVVPWLSRTGMGSEWCGWECDVAALKVSQSIWIKLSPMQSRCLRNINYGIHQHLWSQKVPAHLGQHSWFPNSLHSLSLPLSLICWQKLFS